MPGWTQVAPSSLVQDPTLFARDNFRAVAYRNNITGELVVAFRGTQEIGDLVADMNQFDGHDSRTYRDAIALASALALENPNDDITFTGHSLGGGLATAAALQTGEQAVGFNSAALTEDSADLYGLDLNDANTQVTHLLVPGEAVTALQETAMPAPPDPFPMDPDNPPDRPWVTHPAPGMRHVLDPPDQSVINQAVAGFPMAVNLLLPRDAEESIAAHLMVSVMSSLHNTYNARCP